MHPSRRPLLVFALALVLALPTVAIKAQTLNVPLRFSAVAQDLDRGLSTPIRITIQRWSTDATRDSLLNVLMTKGEDKLLDTLQNAPKVGTIGTTSSLAWD